MTAMHKDRNTATLPEGFEFSQGVLQDLVDCPRRFELQYVSAQPWPAVEVEPVLEREVYNQRGRQFHRLLERYYTGIPLEAIESSLSTDQLRTWWNAFLQEPPLNLPREVVLPEVRLATALGGQRLVCVTDLLAVDPGRRLVIVDWKTGRFRPSREAMAQRLQTRIYPFVAVEAGGRFFGGPVEPARVSMVYWFANYPDQPHVFHYDQAQHDQTRNYLEGLLREAEDRLASGVWEMTTDERLCSFCIYRSLCGRGITAGRETDERMIDLGDVEPDWESLRLEDVDEIAY